MTEVLPRGKQSDEKERENYNFHLSPISRVSKIGKCAVEPNSP
jgi:hypothetical protein